MRIDRGKVRITPRCAGGENVFISNEGWLLPCHYSHMSILEHLNRGYETADVDYWFVRNRVLFDLKLRSVQDVLSDQIWNELMSTWESENTPRVCVAHCSVPVDGKTADELHKARRSIKTLR
jgi:hypothetical protein